MDSIDLHYNFYKVFPLFILFLLFARPVFALELDIHPQSEAYYHFLLGEIARIEERDEVAIEEYRKVINYDPTSSFVRLRLARILAKYGFLEEAALHLEEAILISPDDIKNYLILGQIYLEMKNFD